MSSSSKRYKPRRIVIENQSYYWYVRAEENLELTVFPDKRPGQAFRCTFDYHLEWNSRLNMLQVWNGLAITPSAVRRAMEYALSHGWQPLQRLPDLRLGPLGDKIQLDHFPQQRSLRRCSGLYS